MTNYFPRISAAIIAILLSSSALFAQQSVVSGLRSVPNEAAKAEGRIQDVLSKSEKSFKQGLLNLKDNKRPQARDDFDHSVEAFLLSGINVRSSATLQKCYSELIETVYRIEIPSTQTPEIKGLALTCGWTLENEYGDIAVALQQPTVNTQPAVDSSAQIASVGNNQLPLASAPKRAFRSRNSKLHRSMNWPNLN